MSIEYCTYDFEYLVISNILKFRVACDGRFRFLLPQKITETVMFQNSGGVPSMDNPFYEAATLMRSRADSFRNLWTPKALNNRMKATATVNKVNLQFVK